MKLDWRFRPPEAIRARIGQLLELCGEDPGAAFAAKYDALPLLRELAGWTGLRGDGVLIFVDEETGRLLTDLPGELVERAVARMRERYPEIEAARVRSDS